MSTSVAGPELSASGEFILRGALFDQQDINPDLHSGRALTIYDKMRSQDGEIAGSLSRLISPILSATATIEAPEGEDPEKHEPTLLCRKTLFRDQVSGRTDVQTWTDILRHIMLMVPFGVSLVEKVWGTDEDGHQVYDHFVPILPKTIYKFNFAPNGSLESVTQRAYNLQGMFREVDIPAEKIALFVFGREGRNLFGRSVLRSAYGHWIHKKLLMETSSIAFERSGIGIAWVEIPLEFGTVTEDQRGEFEKTVRELRAHQRQGVYVPPGCKLHVDYPSGTAPNAVPLLNYYDQQMSRSMLTEFMATGTAETGSRSVVASKIDLMMLAIQGTLKLVEEGVNQQLIVELVDRNFGRQEAYPRLQFEDMDKMSGEQKATILKLLADAKLLLPDKVLRAHLRETNDLPPEDEATLEVPQPMAPFGTPQPNGSGPEPNGNGNGKPPVNRIARELKAADAERLGQLAAAAPLRREPYPHEAQVRFADIATYLDEEPIRIWHRVVAPIRDEQIARIAEHAASASDADLAQGKLIRPAEKRLSYELTRALLTAYMEGRKAVRAEVAGGVPEVALLAAADGEEEDGIAPTPAEQNWIRRLAEGFVSASTIGLTAAAVREAITARQADLPRPEVERRVLRALQSLSIPTAQADLAGSVTTAYTTGRNDQGTAMRSEIESEHYSAMLDSGTCEPCASMDGMEQAPGDGNFTTPNPQCEGGMRCRCVTIYVAREKAA